MNEKTLKMANAAITVGDKEKFLSFCTDNYTVWIFVGDVTLIKCQLSFSDLHCFETHITIFITLLLVWILIGKTFIVTQQLLFDIMNSFGRYNNVGKYRKIKQ